MTTVRRKPQQCFVDFWQKAKSVAALVYSIVFIIIIIIIIFISFDYIFISKRNASIMSSDDESSSSSDEDFLTQHDSNSAPREALVRKKLLEHFYGKSPDRLVWTDDDSEDDNEIAQDNDLDSPAFHAQQHTDQLIVHESVQTLLEHEEQLALQVRTLDSTMQTMVYENYSRFIDATDAIRSIGVHVTANEVALQQFSSAVHRLDEQSRHVEDALGALRDQVAEKIRVQRLLTRLDTLLKLPATLQQHIQLGQYQTAAKSYTSAAPILARHSAGFESLKTIEAECQTILKELQHNVQNKLLHWSGTALAEEELVPNPPQSMMEIYECVGTMQLLLQQDEHDESTLSAAAAADLESMACSASLRLLDRILDTHLIDVQERRFSMTSPDSPSSLIATDYLNAMLEAATLFTTQFVVGNSPQLVELISESFSSFLVHTKAILLDEQPKEADEETTLLVAEAMTLLIQSVQDLSNSLLAMGIRSEWTAQYVAQATQLTESLTRRRVDQRFHALQNSIVEDSWLPLCQRLAEDTSDFTQLTVLAQSTVSDCLQLVDDTIRSCCSSVGEQQPQDLKKALTYSARKFSFWWANALEQMAGGECTRYDVLAAPVNDETTVRAVFATDEDEEDIMDTHSSWQKMSDMLQTLTTPDGDLPVHLVLVVAKMCVQAESSVSNSLEEFIATHLSGGKKSNKSRIIVPGEMLGMDVMERFQLARSTVFALYASHRGAEMANFLCEDINKSENHPKESTRQALAIAKRTCQELNGMLQGNFKARDIPELEDASSRDAFSPMARKSGLRLDIERMFQEKVAIYPHPSSLLDVHDIMFLVFKVAIRAWYEQIRLSIFTADSRPQLLMDAMLLKHMLTHYLSETQATTVGNMIDDCKMAVGDRMDGASTIIEDDEETVIDAVRSSLKDAEWTDVFVLK